MTDPSMATTAASKKSYRKWWGLAAAAVILLLTLAGSYYVFAPAQERTTLAENIDLGDRVGTLEHRMDALEQRMTAMESHAAAGEENKPAQADKGTAASTSPAQDFSRLRSDVVSLSAAMSALQAEVKQSGTLTNRDRKAAQTTLASVVAYTELRNAADAGRGFADALGVMRRAAGNDAVLQEQLVRLEPYAADGAPVQADLRETFLQREPAIENAIEKADARGWKERVLAEFKGMISIRRRHASTAASGTVASIEAHLADGDLGTALDEGKALPENAQAVLADWRKQAEARWAIDQALQTMAGHLIDRTAPAAPAPAQDAP